MSPKTKTGSTVDAGRRSIELDAIFDALAHPTRRQLLTIFWFGRGTISSGYAAKHFRDAWPTISRHLRVLETAGLISCEKSGRTRLYRVNPDQLSLCADWLAFFRGLKKRGK